jgi:hypothetical protein
MITLDFVVQPTARTTLDVLDAIVQQGDIQEIDVAVAYITSGGAHDFLKRVSETLGDAWGGIQKRWITSFDYCRTEPVAREILPGSRRHSQDTVPSQGVSHT